MAKSPISKMIEAAEQADAAATPTVEQITAKTVGKFSFVITRGAPVPVVTNTRAASQNELPFKEIFPAMQHNDLMFVPDAFWTAPKSDGGREVPAEKATPAFIKGKIRGAFNAWVSKEPDTRKKWALSMMHWPAGGNNGAYPEAGMSYWLSDSTLTAPTPQE